MQWKALGIVIDWRIFGENRRLLTLLTQPYGLHKGILYGHSRTLLPGWVLHVHWKGTSEMHLGAWHIEDSVPLGSELYNHALAFTLLKLMCHLCLHTLHVQVPCVEVYRAFLVSMTLLAEPKGFRAYVCFEAHVLIHLGYSDERLRYFVDHWHNTHLTPLQSQWQHHKTLLKRIGNNLGHWYKARECVYHQVFLNTDSLKV
jgi:recombinational DNA repair protein (RecF pathway)